VPAAQNGTAESASMSQERHAILYFMEKIGDGASLQSSRGPADGGQNEVANVNMKVRGV
jgi:hypothetical protein